MKRTSATIRLQLWKSKTLSDGTNPIVIVVRWNGEQKTKSTGYSVNQKNWDDKNESVKRGYPNYAAINAHILEMKNKVMAKKLEYEKNSEPYTASMLIEAISLNTDASGLDFLSISNKIITDNKLTHSSAQNYYTTYNALKTFFGRDFIITELDSDTLIAFAQSLTLKHSTIKSYFARIKAVLNYADTHNMATINIDKANEWLTKHIKPAYKHRALSEDDIIRLKVYYWDEMDKSDIMNRRSKAFIMSLFMFCYYCNGIAPIDAIQLKTDNVSLDGNKYIITTRRNKTSMPIRIVLMKSVYNGSQILEMFLPTAHLRNGYIFPFLCNNEHTLVANDTPQQIHYSMATLYRYARMRLDEVSKELDIPKFSLYTARHTAASIMLKNKVPIGQIASAMARSVSRIEVYLDTLTTDQALSDISTIL
jgi:integrase